MFQNRKDQKLRFSGGNEEKFQGEGRRRLINRVSKIIPLRKEQQEPDPGWVYWAAVMLVGLVCEIL